MWMTILLLAFAVPQSDQIQVKIDPSEAESVLAILDRGQMNEPALEDLWEQLFATEGYRRLKEREASMDRAFTDDSFREFVLSPELLEKREALRNTLASWGSVDPKRSAQRVLGYLPETSTIQATIYPMIKPRSNNFVFNLKNDPAIFFFLDPDQSSDIFENLLAHELHHVGYATACSEAEDTEEGEEQVTEARRWIGAFGEGIAMLAAAGGHEIHPHAVSSSEDRKRWNRDMANFDTDLKLVEKFFQDILEGRLSTRKAILDVARSFYGVQGPWYTVGWKMAATIESRFGRHVLVGTLCDPVEFLATYDRAAPEGQARWASLLLKRLHGGERAEGRAQH